MAYLTDFLTFSSAAHEEQALASPEFKEWKELKKQCDMMIKRGMFDGIKLTDPEERVLKKEERLVSTIWKKYKFLPCGMSNSALGKRTNYGDYLDNHCTRDWAVHDLTEFSRCPQMELAEIRDVANKLSLMILPIQYFDAERVKAIAREFSYRGYYTEDETDSAKRLIARIMKYVEQDLYVLCPISAYNVGAAENDTENREVIFGGELMRVKLILDTIVQIQRNLFAILRGNEGDTAVWEIGEGTDCTKRELRHLQVIIETIMPIQHSLLEYVRKSKDMQSWEKKMRAEHLEETARILREESQKLSWMKEARQVLREAHAEEAKDSDKASWVIPEAAAMTSIMFFSLPHGTSLIHNDGPAKLIKYLGVEMPESFYLNRGFTKRQDKFELYHWTEELNISL